MDLADLQAVVVRDNGDRVVINQRGQKWVFSAEVVAEGAAKPGGRTPSARTRRKEGGKRGEEPALAGPGGRTPSAPTGKGGRTKNAAGATRNAAQ